MVYFSSATLILGIVIGCYFLFEWLLHKRRYKLPLFWAIGLFFLYWFLVPYILGNAGFRFTLTDFNVFYSFAFPVTFGGLILVYLGILTISPFKNQKRINRLLTMWFVLCLLVFSFYFLVRGGEQTGRSPLFITTFLFFLPLRLLILFAVWKLMTSRALRDGQRTRTGIALVAGWGIIGIIGQFLAIWKVLLYPPQFWYLALVDFKELFLLQSVSMLMLSVGFFLVHRRYFRGARRD